ncbi:MAG: hypothetical protein MUE37_08825 [Bacteroidales bacterium]|jgi:hypothetical protein|nr:hypothetical protein [Bacteroidales bacterium]
MKRVRVSLIIACTVAFMHPVAAQNLETDNLENLVFPRFQESVVRLKTGQSYKAVLNYEKTEQQMVLIRNNQLFLFKDHQAVDTVYMGDRVFVPAGTGFYEVLVSGPASLFVQHKARLDNTGTTLAYGTKTSTAGVTHITKIFSQDGAVNLKIPENYKVVDDSDFLLGTDGQIHTIVNKKQFLKLFPGKSVELEEFIRSNKTDFKSADDLVSLVEFLNGLQ